MSMTALEITQAVMAELGLGSISSAVGSSNQVATQIVALANAVGRQITQANDWQALQKEHSFSVAYYTMTGTTTEGSYYVDDVDTTYLDNGIFAVTGTGIPTDTLLDYVITSSQVQLSQPATASGSASLNFVQVKYSLPDGFSSITNSTQWDKSTHLEIIGPDTPQLWQNLKSGYLSTGPRLQWRLLGDKFEIYPPNANDDLLQFEYVSKYWASSASGTAKGSFTADTDYCIFPDELMIAGAKLKFLQAKGLPSDFAAVDYMDILASSLATDAAAPILRMAGRSLNTLIGPDNIPDSGYGS
jgi:hypothetical protein